MNKRLREAHDDNGGRGKRPRIDAISDGARDYGIDSWRAGTDERPNILYQQFLRPGETYGDIFLLTRDRASYTTPMELAKTDSQFLRQHLAQAGLPEAFAVTATASIAEAPSILVQVEKETFVAAEALLPYAHKIGKPLAELFPKERIFIRNLSTHGEPRYVELGKCKQLYRDEMLAMGQQALETVPHLKDNQRTQLGLETRPHAPRVVTTRDHAQVILEKLGEPKWLAAKFPERPPLFVYGDDEIFSEGVRKVSPRTENLPNPTAPDASRIFVLTRPNWPQYGVDNPNAGKPEYKELSRDQYFKLKALKDYLRQHLGRLGIDERWARSLDDEERFYLGIDDNPEASWSEKLRVHQKRQYGITGETAKRYYVCQPAPPTLSRKVISQKERKLDDRPEFLVETRPGVYEDVKAYKEMIKQQGMHPHLQRNHNKAKVLIKFEGGAGYVTPEELKRLVGDQQFSKMMSGAKLPQFFKEEARMDRPAILVDAGNGRTFLSAERVKSDAPGKQIPNYISFDRILVRTEHGNYMNMTKALSLGNSIDKEARDQIGLPLGLGQQLPLATERTSRQQEATARSFIDRERSVAIGAR